MKLPFKPIALLVMTASFLLQACALIMAARDLLTVGRIDFGAVVFYLEMLSFSVPMFLGWLLLIQLAKIKMPTKLISSAYLGSHLLIIICMFVFPGKFA